MDEHLEKARKAMREGHQRLVDAGKCAKRPRGLLGPVCDLDSEHEGRCSWGAFFEPDGSFHAVDPHSTLPVPRHLHGGY